MKLKCFVCDECKTTGNGTAHPCVVIDNGYEYEPAVCLLSKNGLCVWKQSCVDVTENQEIKTIEAL